MGGGSLGPDLSHVATRYGEAGLTAALTGLPFPTMQGVFAARRPRIAASVGSAALGLEQGDSIPRMVTVL